MLPLKKGVNSFFLRVCVCNVPYINYDILISDNNGCSGNHRPDRR